MFKVGDKVKVKSGSDTRLSKSDEFEVQAISDTGRIFIREYDFQGKLDSFEPMIFTLSGEDSPIRTVTRREVVPGTYGRVEVSGTYKGERVTLDWSDNGSIHTAVPIVGLNAEELREAAHIFNQLAEALEDKP